jgi:hypothetical protein
MALAIAPFLDRADHARPLLSAAGLQGQIFRKGLTLREVKGR